jgi:hypothetical protein
VSQDEWVVVRVDDAAGGADLLRDLVRGSGCGQPGADVEKLAMRRPAAAYPVTRCPNARFARAAATTSGRARATSLATSRSAG